MDIDQVRRERESVVGSALGWLGTPYHHMGQIKGVGADCITFLRGAFVDARLGVEIDKIKYYPMDWHMHRDAERYIEGLLHYCTEMPDLNERPAEPGDILLFRFGRVFAHGALVLDYPTIIHSIMGRGVVRDSFDTSGTLQFIGEGANYGKVRPMKVFTLKRWVL